MVNEILFKISIPINISKLTNPFQRPRKIAGISCNTIGPETTSLPLVQWAPCT